MFNVQKFQPLMMLPQQMQMQKPQMGYTPGVMPQQPQQQGQQPNPMSGDQAKGVADMFKGMKNALIGDDPMMSQAGQKIWDNALAGNASFGDATRQAAGAAQDANMGFSNPLAGNQTAQFNPLAGVGSVAPSLGQQPGGMDLSMLLQNLRF